MPVIETQLSRLFSAADDTEAYFIREAAYRAGLLWECEGCWTNEGDNAECERCGAARPEAAR